ncbi:MAG: BON domain-containing protein [Chloroflexi bacterium]|nr:BON domain-containing protein [Chloroflexota bacterium]
MNNNNNDNLAAPDTGSALTGDDAIMNQINQALRSNATTARSAIDVAAIGATVTLSGTVGSQDVKRTAEQLARGVPGVVDVTNELVIGNNAGGEVFGIFGNRDNDADGGDNDTVNGVATGGLGAIPLVGGNSGASSGTGIGYGVPLAMGLAGENEGSSASGETRQSRNADTEEQDLS